MKRFMTMILALSLCVGSYAAESLPEGFGPSPASSVESRLTSLEIAVQALDIRVTEVEKIANEDFIRKIVKEMITTELGIMNANGKVEKRTVSYAGYGSFEIPPGGSLYSVDGVLVNPPVVRDTVMGQPSAYYATDNYQIRVQQPVRAMNRPLRMWIRGGSCAGGVCR